VGDVLDGIWNRLSDWLVEAGTRLAHLAANVLWATVILIVAVFVVRRLRERVRALLDRRKVKGNAPELITNLFTIAAYTLAGLFMLTALGADSSSLVTAFGLITAAVSLSLQDVLKNFVAGIYLLAEQPFLPGDRIRVAGEEGRVVKVDIRTTMLRNDRAELVLVPNYKVFSEVVGNRSKFRLSGVTIQVTGVPGSPAEAAEAALAVVNDAVGHASQPPRIDVTKVAPAGVDLQLIVWSGKGSDGVAPLRSAVVRALHERFPDATVSVVTP
jgi:small-conductance mechanosensitive channel